MRVTEGALRPVVHGEGPFCHQYSRCISTSGTGVSPMLIIRERATRVWQSVLLVTFPTILKAVASPPVKNCHVLAFTVHAWQASPGVDTKEPTPSFLLG